jgi:hypothetical protein
MRLCQIVRYVSEGRLPPVASAIMATAAQSRGGKLIQCLNPALSPAAMRCRYRPTADYPAPAVFDRPDRLFRVTSAPIVAIGGSNCPDISASHAIQIPGQVMRAWDGGVSRGKIDDRRCGAREPDHTKVKSCGAIRPARVRQTSN